MSYDEKIINGILHYRHTSDEMYSPFTVEALTTAFIAVKSQLALEKFRADRLQDAVSAAQKILRV